MLTSRESFLSMHNALHCKKNMKPYCTQGNGEVDCNVASISNIIPLGFKSTIRTPKVYHFFMSCKEQTPCSQQVYLVSQVQQPGCYSDSYRITERLRLERTSGVHLVPRLKQGLTELAPQGSVQTQSTSKEGDSTASLGTCAGTQSLSQ